MQFNKMMRSYWSMRSRCLNCNFPQTHLSRAVVDSCHLGTTGTSFHEKLPRSTRRYSPTLALTLQLLRSTTSAAQFFLPEPFGQPGLLSESVLSWKKYLPETPRSNVAGVQQSDDAAYKCAQSRAIRRMKAQNPEGLVGRARISAKIGRAHV